MSVSHGFSGPANRLPMPSGAETNSSTTPTPTVPASHDLIAQAEHVLRTALQDVMALIAPARQQRLMKTTLASLKQLQELEV